MFYESDIKNVKIGPFSDWRLKRYRSSPKDKVITRPNAQHQQMSRSTTCNTLNWDRHCRWSLDAHYTDWSRVQPIPNIRLYIGTSLLAIHWCLDCSASNGKVQGLFTIKFSYFNVRKCYWNHDIIQFPDLISNKVLSKICCFTDSTSMKIIEKSLFFPRLFGNRTS